MDVPLSIKGGNSMNDYKNDMIIFIASPDSYKDVLKVFMECFNLFCKDCPYELIISTNNGSYEGITVYNNHEINDSWMNRTIPVIREQNAQYILLLCDDMIITEKVDFNNLATILQTIKEKQINFCGLTNHIRGKKVSKGSPLEYVKKNKAYSRNLQAGIFQKDYFLDILGDGELSPWDLEEKWLKEAMQSKGEYFNDIVSCSIDVLHCCNGVYKGKWYWSCYQKLLKMGIKIDDSRDVIPRKEEIKMALYAKIGKTIPSKFRPYLKKAIRHTGHKFSTNY